MNEMLHQCEMEVEQARVKLTSDLAALRVPGTSSFKENFKREALDAKDALVEQVKQTAQSKFETLIEDLKAKAAANPAAALTILAGVAWQLIRKPPISTALIGAGLYSLFRTNIPNKDAGQRINYFREGQERLKEQIGEFASNVSSAAVDVGDKLSMKTDEFLKDTTQSVRKWSYGVRDDLAAAGMVGNQTQTVMSNANRIVEDVADQAGGVAANATGREALSNAESRDQILLGVAGLAVAAALGITCQKRLAQQI